MIAPTDQTHDGRRIPTINAEPTGDDRLRFFCRYCDRYHYHGAGHRVAHCSVEDSPYRDTGYVLIEGGPGRLPFLRFRPVYSDRWATRILSGFVAAQRKALADRGRP